jgi:phosphoribosylamine--glycine ligase
MQKHNIPTAYYAVFNNRQLAKDYILEKGAPIVVKDDGLAAGKGVVVAMTITEALDAVDLMLGDDAIEGKQIVIEEFLEGEEASFIVMVDGKNILPLATSQDHKRLKDSDMGPNTGGMGAYSPAPVVTPQTHARIMREIIEPTVKGMEKDGIPYTGFLYAGVMIDNEGNPKTLEFNCRMGDPETQPIMARMKSNLVEIFKLSFEHRLHEVTIDWDRRCALGVVLASHNYPNTPRTGDKITGAKSVVENTNTNQAIVFHAGTKQDSETKDIVTSGGRVLCVVGLGDSVKQAKKQAYDAITEISFDGMQFRTDIGYRAIK